ncbi:MAG TPA: zinc-ribbon domain-containing protein, partial [Candidatus Polarisedimenticolia bacterium]|nr:zinc-ribbon domain-containing protein [Candidatus Polarisedimenticolia bacterium]
MHVECSACHARYTIADDKIPAQGARVRCRKCQAVFSVEKPVAPAPSELPLIPPTPEAPPSGFPMDPGITQGPTFGSQTMPPASGFTTAREESNPLPTPNPFGPPPGPVAPM